MAIDSAPSADHASIRRLFVPVALFIAAAAVTIELSGGPATILQFAKAAPFILGLIATAALVWHAGDAAWERRVLTGVWVAVFAVSALNILFGWVPLLVYGDGNILIMYLTEGSFPAKWLGGFGVLEVLFNGLWHAPPIHARLSDRLAGADTFVMLASTAAVSGGALLLLRAWGDRLAVRMAAVAPYLFVLSPGYREYYPFIVCLYVGTLCFALSRPLDERPPWLLGAIAGALPAVYIGFIPWAAIFFVASVAARPRKAWILLLSAVTSFLAVVRFFWAGSFRSFFIDYFGNLRLTKRIPFERYDHQISADRSVFFRPGYVLHPEHLADLDFAAFYLGLTFAIILAAVAFFLLAPSFRERLRPSLREPRFWLCAALLIQQTHYFFFMVPHFGPRHDIDVYFSVPIIAMFFAGTLFEQVLRDRGPRARRIFSAAAFPLILGHASALVTAVMIGGLPNIYHGMDHVIQVPAEGATANIKELRQSFDGAGIVNSDSPGLFVYATYATTIAAEIDYAGAAPRGFTVTQFFTDSNSYVRAEASVNGGPAGVWGGTPEFTGAGSTSFTAVLKPGRNRYAIQLVPLEARRGDACVHLGRLMFTPK